VKPKILYYSGWLLTRAVSWPVFRMRISGTAHVPKTGGFILACNHRSYYDPLLVGSWSPRQMYFFAKEELFRHRLFGWVITRTNAIPVKRGRVDRQALSRAIDVIKRGYGLTLFPEGTRSKTGGFLQPRAGVGMIAVQAGCPIVPAYLHGSNRLKDCLLGRQRLSLTFGPMMTVDEVAATPAVKEGYQELAARVMARIRTLAAEVQGADADPAR